MSDTVPQASALLKRALKQLVAWQAKYGDFNPKWLPPAGDVRLAEDIGEYLASQAPAPAAIAEQLQPSGASPAAVEAEAARYRWLRDHSQPGICTFYLSVGNGLHGVKFTRETVDEAIDAQIAALADPEQAQTKGTT